MNRKGLFLIFFFLNTSFSYSQHLSKKAAESFANSELIRQSALQMPKASADWERKEIQMDGLNMRFAYRVIGEKPEDGRSLYISMHGGGGTTAAVNDQQWKNQIMLYTPEEGVYVAPRAPTNTWNLWHRDHIDDMFSELIKAAILKEDVNPNKVYILGYSAGGDGTFQLAPRMADYWAAAAMMAGHPGDAAALNLRNLPFSIFMGGVDAAYDRNKLAKVWEDRLDSLERTDPGHYVHNVHIYPDVPHWMNRKDSIAMPWLASFTRNSIPEKVVWVQDDRHRDKFYWLGVPSFDKVETGAKAIVSISGNTITIEENENPTLHIYLNDRMLNLDKKVKVINKGKVVFNSKVKRDPAIISTTVEERLDKDLVFYSRLVLENGRILGGKR